MDKNENHNAASVYRIYIHHPVRLRGRGEIPELGGTVRAFYIGYVLGTSHEPDRSSRLPLHPKEERP